jgi:hypothetical protein
VGRFEYTPQHGGASIVFKADRSVIIKGNNIRVESSGRTSIKASKLPAN